MPIHLYDFIYKKNNEPLFFVNLLRGQPEGTWLIHESSEENTLSLLHVNDRGSVIGCRFTLQKNNQWRNIGGGEAQEILRTVQELECTKLSQEQEAVLLLTLIKKILPHLNDEPLCPAKEQKTEQVRYLKLVDLEEKGKKEINKKRKIGDTDFAAGAQKPNVKNDWRKMRKVTFNFNFNTNLLPVMYPDSREEDQNNNLKVLN